MLKHVEEEEEGRGGGGGGGEKDVNTPVRHNMPRKSVISEE